MADRVSFGGIGAVVATFAVQEGVKGGQVVKLTGNGQAGPCESGDQSGLRRGAGAGLCGGPNQRKAVPRLGRADGGRQRRGPCGQRGPGRAGAGGQRGFGQRGGGVPVETGQKY